jgi:heme-degrading monooxygenase HmoA
VIAKPEMIDTAIAQVRDEVLPAIQGMKGCLGLSMLIDRETGRGIVTTAWETIEDLTASREMVREMRDRVTQTLGADKADVEEWEVAAMHRNHHTSEGSCARVTWLKGDPADLDRAVDIYKLAAVPAMEELPGFCSSSLLVDRGIGRAVSTATYDNREALEASRAQAEQIRAGTAQEARAEVLDVAEFDLVLAHLNIPEMA